MKKLAFVVAAVALALPAAAQQQKQTKLGLGVSFAPAQVPGVNAPSIEVYMPIDIGATLRVEPSLGIFTENQGGAGTDSSNITLGAGVFGMKRIAQPVNLYFGGRAKLNFASVDTGAASDSGTDLSLAGALGAEYYFVPNFSLGLEGQLGFYSNSDVSGDSSGFFTNGLGFLRMYF
jgi:hypothetical protein